MTRINIHVPPKNLCNEHLFAEYREAKRIPNAIKSGKAVLKNIPTNFRLQQGHVKYFYNKLGYLKDRYYELYDECIERGINVQDYRNVFDDLPPNLMQKIGYKKEDRDLVVGRIEERLSEMEKIHYFNNKITNQEAIKILNRC